MLKLIVDNTHLEDEYTAPTCRANCELFDPITEECGVKHNINPDDPLLASRCGDMIYKDEEDTSVYLPSTPDFEGEALIEDGFEEDLEEEMFLTLNGETFDELQSKYPVEPDYPSKREDATWFISNDKSFGCWLINKSKKRFMVIENEKYPEKGWSRNIYKSPYPLHDHKAALEIASKMAWYVDEEGYGQYVLLCNGKVSMLSATKPINWETLK
ncbi:hypothetical protein [Halobacillus litoralis]|uniref:Uncharacterized protein n=1 Tax=Halobacillus litoralis TaxID=45668 RepID=A0A410MJF6_9BACI|nr:hypothetical protein [Halobacillus litoralis]QAS54862.1 hypothetical protein HLI_21665 [Halobacillus litoralis]